MSQKLTEIMKFKVLYHPDIFRCLRRENVRVLLNFAKLSPSSTPAGLSGIIPNFSSPPPAEQVVRQLETV